MDVDPDSSSATKAEDCEVKAGDSYVDQMSSNPATVADYLVYEFKTSSSGVSADECSDMAPAEEPMNASHISHNGVQMDEKAVCIIYTPAIHEEHFMETHNGIIII